MSHLRTLYFGHQTSAHSRRSPLKNQVFILLRIWRNYTHTDFGIERLVRLFLAGIQFLSLGLYLRQLLRHASIQSRKALMEVYVVLKMSLPLVLMSQGYVTSVVALWTVVYFMIETIAYLMGLIFLSDANREPVSPKRSLILLFINFFEIVFYFAFIYYRYDVLDPAAFNLHFQSSSDAVYFSFVTAGTVGYGDIVPLVIATKQMAIVQITLTFIFVALFLNYFNNLLQRNNHFPTELRHRKTRHGKRK